MILLTVLGTIMQFRMLNETFVAEKFTCMTEEWKSHEEVANTVNFGPNLMNENHHSGQPSDKLEKTPQNQNIPALVLDL